MSDTNPVSGAGNRLAKVIARAGLCSRRDAEEWIIAGRVSVNGKAVRTPAFNVTESDEVMVDGNPLTARAGTRVWLYHKPAGLVVTEKDPEGRPTIFEALEKHGLPRVLTIGRLDINTEGLLLLTNDGGLKRVLELPATGWLRRYRVRAYGNITQAQLDRLKDGIEVEGVKYGPIDAALEREQGSNVWLTIALREGKNREIKNVLAAMGLQVNRLIRTSYGPFQLGELPIGSVTAVRARVLRDQLGIRLAEQAGVDFDSPLPEDTEPQQVARNPNQRVRKGADGEVVRGPKSQSRSDAPRRKPAPKQPRRAPERKGNFDRPERPAREEKPVEKRVVHFGGERGAEEFEPKAKRKPDDKSRDFKPARAGDRPQRRDDRPKGDRPDRRDDRPRGERPPRREDRPGGERPARRDDARRPNDRPRSERPRFGDKPGAPRGGGRGKPSGGGNRGRPAGGKPGGPRKGPPRGRGPR